MRTAARTSGRAGAAALQRLEPRLLLEGGPVLSEFLADNVAGLTDIDGEASDWIELYNPTSAEVDLAGWYLTDDPDDLTQWQIPAIDLAPGEYRVIFASGKDRTDPAGELHTNFKLDADGEDLLLVEPDGVTVASQFAGGFPEQYEDVSYGLAQNVTTLLAAGAPVRYHVPVAADAALGATWALPAFDDAAWSDQAPARSPTVVLTEMSMASRDFVEIQNVTGQTVDTSGWFVTLNNPRNGNINETHGTWTLPGTMAPGEVLYRDDNASGGNYWGENILWPLNSNGWAMVVDDQGAVADFAIWGYAAGDLATLDITEGGVHITGADVPWQGLPAGAGGTSTTSLQRTGSTDHDTAADFGFAGPITMGTANAGLATPLAPVTTPAITGIGYGADASGFEVTRVTASVTINSVTEAEAVLADPGKQASVLQARPETVNYLSTGGAGHFGGDSPFPGLAIGTDDNNFVIEATAGVLIPRAGAWTFGVNSDDGFALTLRGAGEQFSVAFPGVRGASDTLGVFDIPQPGVYDLRLVYFERTGGAGVEMFAAEGSFGAFDDAAFALVGDTGAGGLAAGGLAAAIATDVGPVLRGVNSSLWTRQEFDLADLTGLDTLLLRVKYDDGFVAWLNGQEIARRNAPTAPGWDALATAARDDDQTVVFEEINVSAHAGALAVGTNVLAVQAMNVADDDGDFLILPELVVTGSQPVARYFATPTPGAANLSAFQDYAAEVEFSVEHGFFTQAFDLSLATATPGATVRYTLDGSEPTETHGSDYTQPIAIDRTTVIRAAAFKIGYEPSIARTRTYLFLADVLTQSADGSPMPGWPAGPINGQVLDYGMDPDIVNDPVWGPQMIDALTAIPSMSVVTDLDNLFDTSTGIYVNAGFHGADWERPGSLELLDPDGSDGFQSNMGIRIRGGFSRSDANPKHALRVFFRSDYGDAKLRYPLFGSEGADVFDTFDLRTAQNYSWSFQNSPLNAMVREVWSRDAQRDMGQPYTRSRYYHLYVNGVYWGLYQSQERSEASYGETYLGGNADDYDVVKCTGSSGGYTTEATDGTLDAWQDLWNQAKAGLGSDEAYYRAQGLNPDGTRNADYPVLLDVDNLIDYMIIILYTGNKDAPISNFIGNKSPNNWYGIRDRTGDQGFQFFAHDAEHSLLVGDLNINRNGPWPAGDTFDKSNPQWIHQQCMYNAQYRLRFADRVQELFYNDGLLTPQASTQRLLARAAEIESAILAESARWGDAKRTTPFTKNNWQTAVDDIVNTYLPQRGQIVLNQFRATVLRDGSPAPLLPEVDAPALNRYGGSVDPGFALTFLAEGTVYYTLDGTDPRLPGGAPAPGALTYDGSTTRASLVASGATWTYLDDGSDQGSAWRAGTFDDAAWGSGPAPLGYGGNGEVTTVGFGPDPAARYITTYFRHEFQAADTGQMTGLVLRVIRDDGAVVYLNGQEVARTNMPAGTITAATLASSNMAGAAETTFHEFALDPALLVEGANVLAVEIHQVAANSGDIGFDLELESLVSNATPVVLADSALVAARARDGEEWSALTAAQFYLNTPAAAGNLAVTEINYNPYPPSAEELARIPTLVAGDFEFVELRNVGDQPIDLVGAAFVDGIDFTFGAESVATLDPGEYVVVAGDIDAFEARYGDQMPLAGQFSGSLNNGGEQLVLADRFGGVILDFTYNDSGAWPGRADGNGSTLEVLDTDGDYDAGDNWRSSAAFGGTPGAAAVVPVADVVVNEVLTHTDPPLTDTVELHNTTGAAIDIGGWFLSDSEADYRKFQIPAGTVIPAGGYVCFDENDFNPGLGALPGDFAFSGAYGDEVWLLAGQVGGGPTRFVDHVTFQAAANGESFGRYPNATGVLQPMQSRTLGGANSAPRVGPVVISEVNYNSGEPDGADDFEFIEIYNATSAPVDLTDWRVRGGVDYDFDPGVSLGAWEVLVVVSFDPAAGANAARAAAFRVRFGLDASVPLVGGYADKLDNAGEAVRLERPDEPPTEDPTYVPHLLEDEIAYRDDLPWPASADGAGNSLHRIGVAAWGHDVASWAADVPSPGQAARPPEAADDDYDAVEDVRLTVPAPGVLDNDPSTGEPVAVLVSGPSHGQVSLAPDGSFTYDGLEGFHGTDSFTYKVNVNQVDSFPATVTIHVASNNIAPSAGADNYQTAEDTPLVVPGPGVLDNDTDADGDPLAAALVAGPGNGQVVLNADGAFVYTPRADFHGTDSFTYQARDPETGSAPATVTVTVTPVADPPVASAGADQIVFDDNDDWQGAAVLDGSGSSDDEAGLTLAWWLEGRQIGQGASPAVLLPLGRNTILLRATDADGTVRTDVVVVTVEAALGAEPPAMITPAAPRQVDPALEDVPVEWAGHGPGATLDLWAYGPTGWLRYATGIPAPAGASVWDPGAVAAGWWFLSADISRAGVHVDSTCPGPIKVVPQGGAGSLAFPGALPAGEAGLPAGEAGAGVVEQGFVVTSPVADLQVPAGGSVAIRWDLPDRQAGVYSDAAEVFVWALAESGQAVALSPALVPGAGAWTWQTAGAAAGRYRVELRWLGGDQTWQSAMAPAWVEVL